MRCCSHALLCPPVGYWQPANIQAELLLDRAAAALYELLAARRGVQLHLVKQYDPRDLVVDALRSGIIGESSAGWVRQ